MPKANGEFFEVTPSDVENRFKAHVYLNTEDFPSISGLVRIEPPVAVSQEFLDVAADDIGVELVNVATDTNASLFSIHLDAGRKFNADSGDREMSHGEMAEYTVKHILDTLGALATKESFMSIAARKF